MAFDENKYKTIFNSRFGNGAYDAGLNRARDIGRVQAQAKFAKDLWEQKKKEEEKKSYTDALNFFSDPTVKSQIQKDGAYKHAENIKNDPILQESIRAQGYVVEDYIDAMYNAVSNGQFRSEREMNSYASDSKKASDIKYAKWDKESQARGFKSYQDESDFNRALREANANKDTRSGLEKFKDFMSSKDVDKDGERDGLLGFMDRFVAPISKGATEAFAPGNAKQMAQNNPNNPVVKAMQKDRGFETTALNTLGTISAFAAPYSAAYKGADLITNKIPKLANIANPYKQAAARGAIAGGIAEGGVSGINEWVNPDAKNIGDYAIQTGLGMMGGAVIDPAIHGIGKFIQARRGISAPNEVTQQTDQILGLPEPQVRLPEPNSVKPTMNNFDNAFKQPGGMQNPIPPMPNVMRNEFFRNRTGLDFAQQGSNIPGPRNQIPKFNVSRGDRELLANKGDSLLNNISKVETAPTGQFERRLSSVQQEMQKFNHPIESATERIKSFKQEFDEAVQRQYEYLKNSTGKGVQKGGVIKDQEGYVTGRYGRTSNNPQWYRDFFRVNGRRPNNSELKQLAEQHVINGFSDEFGDIPAFIPRQIQEIDNQLDEISTILVENPEQQAILDPIIEALEQDRAMFLDEFDAAITGNMPTSLDADDLYLNVRGENDPQTLDELVRLNQLETNYNKNNPVQGPREGNLKDSLQADDRINELVKGLYPPTRPEPKVSRPATLEEMFQRMSDLAPAKKAETPLEPLQFRRLAGGMERQFKPNAPSNTPKKVSGGKGYEAIEPNPNSSTSRIQETNGGSLKAGKDYEAIDSKIPDDDGGKLLRVDDADNVQPLNLEELQKVKDILPPQVGTQDLYRLANRLPEQQKVEIQSSLDNAKKGYIETQERLTNDLYEKVVKGLGIKKGSKESALVQDFGEKTIAKKYLRKRGIDPKKLSDKELNQINLQQLKKESPDNWQQIVAADNYFRQNYNQLIDQVNKVRAQLYPNNAEKIVPKRSDYYHHFNELEGFEGVKNLFETPANIDPTLEGLSPFTKPKAKFQSFMQKRGNGKYTSDAVGGYLKYTKAASHSINVDPVIPVIRNTANDIATATADTRNANKIIEALNMHANDIAGKTNPVDRVPQMVLGRKGMNILNWVNSRVKSNMILGNLGSTLGQLGNVPLGVGKANVKNTAVGLKDTVELMAKEIFRKPDKSAPIYKSQFLKERYSDALYRRFDQKLIEQPKKLAVWMMEQAEKSGTRLVWNSMYSKALKDGIEDPIKYADYETRNVIAGRGVAEVPLFQKAKTTQILAPFTLEVGNQWRVLKDMVGEKDAGAIITFLIASYGLNQAFEKVRGMGVSLDPIDALIEGYEKGEGDAGDKTLNALASLNGEIVGNIPGGNLLTQFAGTDKKIPGTDVQFKALFGERDPNRFGTGLTMSKALQDPSYVVLPFGASQLRKTTRGIDAALNEGVYKGDNGFIPFTGDKSELNYPINAKNGFNQLFETLQMIGMGPTATNDAREYYNSEKRPLSEKQTAQYEMLKDSGQSEMFYNNLMHTREIETIQRQMKEVQQNQDLTPQEKQQEMLRLMNELYKLQQER